MELIARHGDREERVRIESDGGALRVTVGERTYTVDAARLDGDGGLWSLLLEGGQHEVAVAAQTADRYRVSTPRGLYDVHVTDPLTHLAREAHGAAAAGAGETVAAYMPGRVTAVLVEEGAAVDAGQGVVVLEAMKMENEIDAESAGTVTKIHVEEGQAVEGGDPLFDLGPPE